MKSERCYVDHANGRFQVWPLIHLGGYTAVYLHGKRLCYDMDYGFGPSNKIIFLPGVDVGFGDVVIVDTGD
jgi:hypothetical protein